MHWSPVHKQLLGSPEWLAVKGSVSKGYPMGHMKMGTVDSEGWGAGGGGICILLIEVIK